MAKKNFKDTMDLFMSDTDKEVVTDPAAGQEEVNVPKGYKLVKESKTERTQLLLRRSTKEAIKKAASDQGISMNDLVNNVLEEYLEKGENQQ